MRARHHLRSYVAMASAPGKIAFAGGTLDRAAHLRDDGGADRLRGLDSSRVVLVGDGQTVAVTADGGGLALVPVAAVPGDAELTFLGLDQTGAAVFAYDAGAGWGDREGGGREAAPATPSTPSSSPHSAASPPSSNPPTRRSRRTRSQ